MSIKGFVRGVDQRLTELERRPLATGDLGGWGQISARRAGFLIDQLVNNGGSFSNRYGMDPGELAWLTALPPADADHHWDISGVELSGAGYARQPLVFLSSNFDPSEGHAPVLRKSNFAIVYAVATSPWPPITHFAVMSNFGYVLMVTELAAPLSVGTGQHVEVPVGAFQVKVNSI